MASYETELLAQVPRLRRYARALTGDPVRADDLVQDCLERAWRRMRLWRRGSNLRAWLFTIMHNLFVNEVRGAARRGREVPIDVVDMPWVSPGQEASRLVDELDRGLAMLPVEQREVLLLVALEGLTYEEAASALDVPIGTVMSRLYRARERMRQWADDRAPSSLRVVK